MSDSRATSILLKTDLNKVHPGADASSDKTSNYTLLSADISQQNELVYD